jgi:hypothetical protein
VRASSRTIEEICRFRKCLKFMTGRPRAAGSRLQPGLSNLIAQPKSQAAVAMISTAKAELRWPTDLLHRTWRRPGQDRIPLQLTQPSPALALSDAPPGQLPEGQVQRNKSIPSFSTNGRHQTPRWISPMAAEIKPQSRFPPR